MASWVSMTSLSVLVSESKFFVYRVSDDMVYIG